MKLESVQFCSHVQVPGEGARKTLNSQRVAMQVVTIAGLPTILIATKKGEVCVPMLNVAAFIPMDEEAEEEAKPEEPVGSEVVGPTVEVPLDEVLPGFVGYNQPGEPVVVTEVDRKTGTLSVAPKAKPTKRKRRKARK